MKLFVCQCLNCGTVMVDNNPSDNLYYVDENFVNKLEEQKKFIDEDDGLSYYGCPNCETDSYLFDYFGDDNQLIINKLLIKI